jgi:hypothetical protein
MKCGHLPLQNRPNTAGTPIKIDHHPASAPAAQSINDSPRRFDTTKTRSRH